MPVDFTRLLQKINPEPDGEPNLSLRTMVVDTVHPDGTVDLTTSGTTITNVPRLAGAYALAGARVQVLTGRGTMLVLGPVSGKLLITKGSDQNLTSSSTTLQDVDDMSFEVEPDSRYMIDVMLCYDSPTAADIKFAWDVPSGTNMHRYVTAMSTGTTSNDNASVYMLRRSPATGQASAGTGGSVSAFSSYLEKTMVTVSSTGGTVQLQSAQNSSNAGTTVVRANSIITVERVG